MSDQRTEDLIIFFDTTLRDGGQTRGFDFSAADKQFIAQALDDFGATTPVLIEFADSKGQNWPTVRVSTNIIDASFIALSDGMCRKLLHAGVIV